MTFAISGMRRPKRSASIPKMIAPTGRNTSVAKSVKMIRDFDTLNSAASLSNRKTITKKSKASSVQPRKPAATAWRELDCMRRGIVADRARYNPRTHDRAVLTRQPCVLSLAGRPHLRLLGEEKRHAHTHERRERGHRLLRKRRG